MRIGELTTSPSRFLTLTDVPLDEVERTAIKATGSDVVAGDQASDASTLRQLLAPMRTNQLQTQPHPLAAPGGLTVRTAVQSVACDLFGSAISADAPLMQAGLDSLGATEFRSRLLQRLGEEIELPDTIVFDFPTLRQIEVHLTSSAAPRSCSDQGGDAVLQLLSLLASHGLNAP